MAEQKKVRGTLRAELQAIMAAAPEELYSAADVMVALKIDNKAADNLLRNMRNDGTVFRHIDKDINGDFQHAMKLPANKIEPLNITPRGPQASSAGGKKKRTKLLSAKEIRSMFTVNHNNNAKLEDAVMNLLDRLEELEKEVSRIKAALRL